VRTLQFIIETTPLYSIFTKLEISNLVNRCIRIPQIGGTPRSAIQTSLPIKGE